MTEAELYTTLSGAAGIAGVAEVFNGFIPEGEAYPVISFMLEDSTAETTLSGDSGVDRQLWQIDVFSESYDEALSLEASVRNVMQPHIRLSRTQINEVEFGIYRFSVEYRTLG